uniref:COMM domain-containing protein 3 n=2 Tax=Culex pipiens TaxID=7175 RepID=A0A8D8IKR9_CULPI
MASKLFTEIELSEQVQNGLKLMKDLSSSMKIINKSFNIIEDPSKESISGSEQYSLATVLILACKFDYDEQQLRRLLEIHIASPEIVEAVTSRYVTYRADCDQKNAKFGIALPHVTDANWTLRSDLSSSCYSVSAGNLTFRIELETFNPKTNEKEPAVRFTCTPEELQLLINKLKDIELNCDKLTK